MGLYIIKISLAKSEITEKLCTAFAPEIFQF
jgi:hypothetical protein